MNTGSQFVDKEKVINEDIDVKESEEKKSPNLCTSSQVSCSSSLEREISEYQKGTDATIKSIQEQLQATLQAINFETTLRYNALHKEANNHIVKLQQQIDGVVKTTLERQRIIHEETYQHSQRAKNDAYQRMHKIGLERSSTLAAMIDNLRKDERNEGSLTSAYHLGVPPSTVNFPVPVGNTFGFAGDSYVDRREGLSFSPDISLQPTTYLPHNHPQNILHVEGVPIDAFVTHRSSDNTASSQGFYPSADQSAQDQFCKYSGCSIRPSCNFQGEHRPLYCGTHKLDGMINVTIKRCETPGCNRVPGFNFEGLADRRYCANCKLDGMVNVSGPPASSMISCSNYGGLPFQSHSTGDEVPAATRKRPLTTSSNEVSSSEEKKTKTKGKPRGGRCEAENCMKHPSFNTPGLVGGRFCSAHKLEGMVDVISKRCEMCSKQAAFNYEGQTRGRFCSGHKDIGMVNVKDKLCEFPGCPKYPTANYEGQSGRRFCTTHKLDGMVNFTNKKCEAAGCVKHPKFNFPGKSGRRYCALHKLEGMVSNS